MGRLDRAIALVLAALVAGFGFLPLANWIPGGHEAPWYGPVAADLLNGLGIAVGGGIVLAIFSRKTTLLWRDGGLTAARSAAERHWSAWTVVIALTALVIYGVVARALFAGRPLLIDEIIQVFQGRLLASGRLWVPAASHQEFFSSLHLVEQAGRVYGQFPMGGPAMLALGTVVGAEWLVGPAFGAAGVLVFGALLARIEPRPGARLGALLLITFAPFAVFMSGSHMNHVTALFWLLVGMYGLARATVEEARFRDGFLAGLGLGMAATIRPVDGVAFALPAGAWLLIRAVRQKRFGVLLASGLGIALPLAGLLWANRETTGAPFLFGYTVLWGKAHDLGFHSTPWGMTHTPARGVELINLYFLRLQTYFLESAAPGLIPLTAALALTKRLSAFDRYLLASSVLVVGAYFAYWHDGFYLGPRFMYPLLPVLALWTARFLPALRDAWGGGVAYRAVTYALVIALVLGLATSASGRARQYQAGMLSLRFDPDRAARAAGVHNALIFVRESWGAELVVRMWALGVSRVDADAIYRGADPCRLDSALTALEAGTERGARATAAVQPLLADSTRLINAESVTGDPSLRLIPGIQYPRRCIEKIEANRSGFTLFPPLLLAQRFGNLYARDLGPRDSLLVAEHPGRPLFLLRPGSGSVGAEPRFYGLNRDSLFVSWRTQ